MDGSTTDGDCTPSRSVSSFRSNGWAGLAAAVGRFRADWFRRFLGIEDDAHYRTGARLDLYRGAPPLSDGAFVQFDLRRRSLAGLQTGWLLEGDCAGYHGLRVFTPTAEGEIVDESIRLEPLPGDPLLIEWLARCAAGASAGERDRGEWLAGVYERLSSALA